MRIFLDVGAHRGETLAAVLSPEFGFDRIVCFEPVPYLWQFLETFEDSRLKFQHFGLWNKNASVPVFEPGNKGAGIWKKDASRFDETEICKFRRASDWFRENISANDTVFLKLNVEGAECDILDDLLDSGEFAKVSFAMVDFDVRKIAALKHRESETRARLEQFGFPRVAFSKDVMRGATHAERIANWLRLVSHKVNKRICDLCTEEIEHAPW
jgi:FkbM family methyltransferase